MTEPIGTAALRSAADRVITLWGECCSNAMRRIADMEYRKAANPEAVRALCDEIDRLRELLAEFVDDETCDFDHHGNCQTHMSVGAVGGVCANEVANRLLGNTEGSTE